MNKSILVLIAFMLTGLFSFKCSNDSSQRFAEVKKINVEVDDFLRHTNGKYYKIIEVDTEKKQLKIQYQYNNAGGEIISLQAIEKQKMTIIKKNTADYNFIKKRWEAGGIEKS